MKLTALLGILVASTIVSSANFAFAGGGMEGGGGVGVRCGTKLELLDLHEARLNGVSAIKVPKTDQEAMDLVTNKMANHFRWFTWIDFDNWIDLFEVGIVQPMFSGGEFFYAIENEDNGDLKVIMAPVVYVTSLPLSPDVGNHQISPGCKLEQIAYMTGGSSPKLEIVKSSWNQLDRLSKAALVAHETFYHFDRKQNLRSLLNLPDNQNSQWAREFVGRVFSNQPPPPLMTGVPSDTELIYCSADIEQEGQPYTTFVVRETSQGFRGIFEELLGANDLYQIISDFNGVSFSEFSKKSYEGKLSSTVKLNGYSTATHLKIELTKANGAEEFQMAVFKTASGKTEQIGESRQISCGTVEGGR